MTTKRLLSLLTALFSISLLSASDFNLSFTVNKTQICDGDVVMFTNTTPNYQDLLKDYQFYWELSNKQAGYQDDNFAAVFSPDNIGDGYITLKLESRTPQKVVDSIRINPGITFWSKPDLTISSSMEENRKIDVCLNVNIDLKAELASNDRVITKYTWYPGVAPSVETATGSVVLNSTNDVGEINAGSQNSGINLELKIKDEYGCRYTYVKNDYIFVRQKVATTPMFAIGIDDPEGNHYDFNQNSVTTCFPDLSFKTTLRNINVNELDSYQWTYKDETSTDASFSSAIASPETYASVNFTFTDKDGCSNSGRAQISVKQMNLSIRVKDSIDNTTKDITNGICAGTYYFDVIGDQDSLSWDKDGDGVFATKEDSAVFYPMKQSRTVQVISTLKNKPGCIDTVSAVINVEAHPEVSFTVDPPYACEAFSDFTFSLSKSDEAITSYAIFEADSLLNNEVSSFPYSREFGEGIHNVVLKSKTPLDCGVADIPLQFEVAVPHYSVSLTQPPSHCIPHNVSLLDSLFYEPQTFTDKVVSFEWYYDSIAGVDSVLDDVLTTPLKYTYRDTGIYNGAIIYTTELGCSKPILYTIPVGDKVTIDFLLEDTLACGNGNVLYTDRSMDSSLIEQITVSAVSATSKLGANYSTITYPTYNQQRLISSFDTVGVYDVNVSAVYNECITDKTFPNRIMVNGPIIQGKATQSCDEPWNKVNFELTKRYACNDSCTWEFFKLTSNNSSKVGETKEHIDSVFSYMFNAPGKYAAVVTGRNDTTSCIFTDSIVFMVYNISIEYKPTLNAICLTDSDFKFDSGVIVGSTGIASISSVKMGVTYPSGILDTIPYTIKSNGEIETKETLYLNEKGVHSMHFITTDPHGCIARDTGFIKVYEPVVEASTTDTAGCLPIEVKYQNLSTSDTAFAFFYWETNSIITPSGTTTSLEETFSTEYTEKEDVLLTLTAETVPVNYKMTEGCKHTTVITGAVTPLIPKLGILDFTNKMCLGTEMVIALDTADKVDKVEWQFFATGSWTENNEDTVSNLYDAAGIYDVSVRATHNFGLLENCVNDTTFKVDVRNFKINLELDPNKRQCFKGSEWIVRDTSNVWSDIDGARAFWSQDDEVGQQVEYGTFQFEQSGPGLHKGTLTVYTGYEGCDVLTESVDIIALGSKLDFAFDKDIVCVDEEFEVHFIDTTNLKYSGFQWVFNDGYYDTTQTSFKYQIKSYPEGGAFSMTALQSTLLEGEECGSFEDKVEHTISVRKIEPRFLQNGSIKDLASCPPFNVGFTNESLGLDDPGSTFTWDFGNGVTSTQPYPDTVQFNEAKDYTINLTINNADCPPIIETKYITVYPNPIVSFSLDNPIACEEQIVPIKGVASDTYTYVWDNADKLDATDVLSPVFNPADSTRMFHVTVTTSHDCSITDSIGVFVQNRPHYTGAPYDSLRYFRLDTFVTFRPTDTLVVLEQYLLGNDSLPGIRYKWTPATYLSCDTCANPMISIPDEITSLDYSIRLYDIYGCFDEQEDLSFAVIKDTKFDVPSAFSPNGDGENDILYVRGWAIRELLEWKIFNRWGQEVYSSSNLLAGWDGTYKGKVQANDTYVYTLRIVNFKGEEEFKKGDILLVR